MEQGFDIQKYMTKGVERVVADAVKATLKDPKESAYFARFAAASVKASRKRAVSEKQGEHIPPFLIASITSSCNLHCEGCYSRHNEATVDAEPVRQLSADEWDRIFTEADEIGVSFILLAGGEPLLRKDVVRKASEHPNILFPIFTNGIFLGGDCLQMLEEHRNLVPIVSLEGGSDATDHRRGPEVYARIMQNLRQLHDRGLIFGTSITVTSENLEEATSDEFTRELEKLGCKAVVYVEFVPVEEESEHLALSDVQRDILSQRVAALRQEDPGMVYISFPGDEKGSDGCVAAGRGFFHINSHGDAEPCPFSPYSDINVRDTSLREALHSRLFNQLISEGVLKEEHRGGCTLFERRDQVEAIAGVTTVY